MLIFLVKLFQHGIDKSDVPGNMLLAFIAPIFKGGDRSLPKNYRPVALTSYLFKTMESVIRTVLVDYIETQGLLDQGQHGCRPGRSTLSQLIIQQDWILDQLLEGNNVDMILLDFQKAFDKVDIGLLLKKIKLLGISGPLGTWLGKFMLGRTQAVRVGSTISKWVVMKSGVPQGSVLGALLFLIMIGDMGQDIQEEQAKLLKIVDDSKILKAVNTPEDIQDLLASLQKLYTWQEQNNMSFNAAMFQGLGYGVNEDLKTNTTIYTNDPDIPIEPAHTI